MTDAVPQILLLQPRIGLQADLLKDLYTPLLTKVKGRFRCNESDFTNATDVFAGGKPSVVLAVDGVLSVKQHGVLVQQLAQYTQDGGTVIFCCLFSNFCRPNDMCRLFTRFGLQWKSGDYHRTTFALNEVFQPIFGNQLYSTLKSSYCVKALHVNHVHYNARVYSPAPTSTTQSHVFPAASVDQSQSPAVFTRCGHGYLGYLGDVNNEEGSQALLMAMLEVVLHTSNQTDPPSTTSDIPNRELIPVNPGCYVCGKLQQVKTCGGCRKVQYCSYECQRAAWGSHKEVCNKPTYTSEDEMNSDEEGGELDDWSE